MKHHHITLVTIFITLTVVGMAAWYFLPFDLFPDGDTSMYADNYKQAVMTHNDRCFQLDVADTTELRRQGLSGRESIESNEGMLFLYQLSGEYGFWMKDMNFPIDIIWLNQSDEIVTILSSVSPDSYPEIFYPTDSARKVIEVSAGVAAELDLKEGDMLNVSPATSSPSVDCAML